MPRHFADYIVTVTARHRISRIARPVRQATATEYL